MHVQIDPEILGSTPCFPGTRVPVQTLFDLLAKGRTLDYFVAAFPSVSREQAVGLIRQAQQSVLQQANTDAA